MSKQALWILEWIFNTSDIYASGGNRENVYLWGTGMSFFPCVFLFSTDVFYLKTSISQVQSQATARGAAGVHVSLSYWDNLPL